MNGHGGAETWIWRGWQLVYTSPLLYRLTTFALSRFGWLMPKSAPGLDIWTKVRAKPRFAKTTLHEMARRENFRHD